MILLWEETLYLMKLTLYHCVCVFKSLLFVVIFIKSDLEDVLPLSEPQSMQDYKPAAEALDLISLSFLDTWLV